MCRRKRNNRYTDKWEESDRPSARETDKKKKRNYKYIETDRQMRCRCKQQG